MIINGKAFAKEIEKDLKQKLLTQKVKPTLAVVLVGDNPASLVYVSQKEKACKRVGINFKLYSLPQNISQQELNNKLKALSQQSNVNALLLQLPLSKHLNQVEAINNISPLKDVDGLTEKNLATLLTSSSAFALPCTPLAVIKLIKSVKPSLEGLNACVIGRSNLVGKPLIHLLLNENATVTICHSKTKNLKKVSKKADILISATGVKHLIKAKHVKSGAIVIDVGITKDENGKLHGDVDFKACRKKASYITPVPGGVGPMTVSQLLLNVEKLTQMQRTQLK